MLKKIKIFFIILALLSIPVGYLYFKYFYKSEQKNIVHEQENTDLRKTESVSGKNMSVTIFTANGSIIKRWTGVKKITESRDDKHHTSFYTSDGKLVQIPESVWYIIEEE